MVTDMEAVIARIQNASSYVEVFGPCPEGVLPNEHVTKLYRLLAKVVHPDACRDSAQLGVYTQAFACLKHHHQAARNAIACNEYGKPPGAEVESSAFWHRIGEQVATTDVANVHTGFSSEKPSTIWQTTSVRVCRSPRDNDLMVAEAAALRLLRGAGSDVVFAAFYPALLDSFKLLSSGKRHQVNVFEQLPGLTSLAVVRTLLGGRIDILDVVWIFRRVFYALGYAHTRGIVHGAVTPDSILVLADEHGVVLNDWTCSAQLQPKTNEAILKAIAPDFRDWYPPAVTKFDGVGSSLDVLLAVRCMAYALGGDAQTLTVSATVDESFCQFLQALQTQSAARKTFNGFDTLKMFDDWLQRQGEPFYPRRFHAMTLPTN